MSRTEDQMKGSVDASTIHACLKDRYKVEDAGEHWHFHCVSCRKRWALLKTSTHCGNILHLLNHAVGHEVHKR